MLISTSIIAPPRNNSWSELLTHLDKFLKIMHIWPAHHSAIKGSLIRRTKKITSFLSQTGL
jgi:hypothetical protein